MSYLQNRIKEDMEAIYSQRRAQAELKAAKERDNLYNRYPQLEFLEREVKKAGIANLYRAMGIESDEQDLKTALARRNKFLRDHNISQDYAEADYYCKLCSDSGYLDSNEWCPCRYRLFQDLIRKFLPIPFQQEARFANFNLNLFSDEVTDDNKSARRRMSELRQVADFYVRHFDNIQDQNLIFSGETGTGKTFLMQAIGREVLQQGHSVLYVTAPIMFDWMKRMETLRQSFNPDRDQYEEMELLNDALFSADLLLLDDLGSEITASWTVEANTANLLTLLDTRLHKSLHSIIATNLNASELRAAYDPRTFSRLIGNYIYYRFPDGDIRLKQREKDIK